MLKFSILLILSILSTYDAAYIVCEFRNAAIYKLTDGKLLPEAIDPNLCTHINYDFLKLNPDYTISEIYPNELTYVQNVVDLKLKNPSLKVLASIGGQYPDAGTFSQLARSDQARRYFALYAYSYLRSKGFDGLNIVWTYPNQDKANFPLLLQEVRNTFNTKLLLTITASGKKTIIDSSYDVPKISSIVDYINLMTYDLKSVADGVVGHASQLYPISKDTMNGLLEDNADWVVDYWLSLGAPALKLVLDIPFYGRTFTLADPAIYTAGSIATPYTGAAGPITAEEGLLSYPEVCYKYTLMWKQSVHAYPQNNLRYAFGTNYNNGLTEWVGYENTYSVSTKTSYALYRGLAGVGAVYLDYDDTTGKYCNEGNFPLLSAINKIMNSPLNTTNLYLTTTTIQPTTATTTATTTTATTTTTPPTTTTTTTTTTQPTTTTTQKPKFCVIEYNYNYPGYDIGGFYNATINSCCDQCSKNPSCLSFTLLTDYNYCYLKSAVPAQSQIYAMANAVSGKIY